LLVRFFIPVRDAIKKFDIKFSAIMKPENLKPTPQMAAIEP
jgi:hypothetical protein